MEDKPPYPPNLGLSFFMDPIKGVRSSALSSSSPCLSALASFDREVLERWVVGNGKAVEGR